MINEQARQRLEDWIAREWNSIDFLKTVIKTNIDVYQFLKTEYKKGQVIENSLFRWGFSAFYGMSRVVTLGAQEAFFNRFDDLRETHIQLDPRAITEELHNSMGKYYFSFVTKMLNMFDDEAFPIFDSQVSAVFEKPLQRGETRLAHQNSIYQDIRDTYLSLESHAIIKEFRERFNCPDVGYMKILDTLFWRIGKTLLED